MGKRHWPQKPASPIGASRVQIPHPPPLRLALFECCATFRPNILQVRGQIMADDEGARINAAIALYESKRREAQADIEQFDKNLAQLYRWKAAIKPPEVQPSQSRKVSHEGETIRDMVLRVVGPQPTFRLTTIVDQLIQSGSMSGNRTAIYGTVTSMLRRNGHIFVKVRRGIYRVKQAAINEEQVPTEVRESDMVQNQPNDSFVRRTLRDDIPGLEPRVPVTGAPIPPEIARLSKVG